MLYLPQSYVVPGGRFNEMYGWDSYFIIRGLVQAGKIELARGMVENFFFEIENYGAVLNANRTYYLSRSQPPFLNSVERVGGRGVKTLGHFEEPGGIMMSPYETGMQWDAPFAWAPVQRVDIEGLRRCSFVNEANRTSYEFLSTVAENFRKDGTIRENTMRSTGQRMQS